MKISDLKHSGHWPTLVTSFLYFDYSFMVWTLLGVLANQIAAPESLNLTAQQRFFMVSVPILFGGLFRLVLGLLVDRIGAKTTGIIAQLVVMTGLGAAWWFGLKNYEATLAMGVVLGVAGASFAVAIPQAGRWYPPRMQGLVMGLAAAGNIGVVIDSLLAPRLAAAYGWQAVFGFALFPAVVVLAIYIFVSKEAPVQVKPKKVVDYFRMFRDKDVHWFCFFYTVSFGGFVGLAYSLGMYFKDRFGLTPAHAGDLVALCTAIGALGRPIGGGISDRIGGIRSLFIYYTVACIALVLGGFMNSLTFNVVVFFIACGAFGMANGSVFQLLPQRFGKDLGLMTGLVGCGGGLGGFLLANMMGQSREHTGSYLTGLLIFAGLCVFALIGLSLVKTRWRTTWGALTEARI
ncbi:NNP family nitrate/nitrite transporter-like MFS transporter [Roseimicrobium gellanilyticum]|uniref:NNP family nitrate/nitrite transporter-like MFS transporter n=1 Tax=Roseimicrobium gellanilyticum TaxID=748857 RepID=A0A366HUW0_9BACT|nr:MFS transporter [Roseimicrobium gellanilyticum]RBP47640.1 NNP family nitrate/nitrite transporter-like MFS transporter [Roseimicrobium gellanilyticum]